VARIANLKKVFVNQTEGRPRCAWRLGLQTVVLLLIGAPLVLLVGLAAKLLGHLPEGLSFNSLLRLSSRDMAYAGIFFIAKCLAVVFSLALAARFFDRRPFADLGLHFSQRWWADFTFGLSLGGILMAAIFAVEFSAGWLSIDATFGVPGEPGTFWPAMLYMLAVFSGVGFYEEMLSRGYHIRNLAEGLNLPGTGARMAVVLAWVTTSLLFGFGHALNPNSGLVSSLGVAAAGIMLGLPFVITSELGLSVGLHIGWNFFQGCVFGFPVSGRHFGVSFVAIAQGGPPAWTGGPFGPEAGILGLCACGLGCLLIIGWLRLSHAGCALQAGLASPPNRP